MLGARLPIGCADGTEAGSKLGNIFCCCKHDCAVWDSMNIIDSCNIRCRKPYERSSYQDSHIE